MWLPRNLAFTHAKAGTTVVYLVPSGGPNTVRAPVSVPHAAAPDVAASPADELLRLATAARLRRQQPRAEQPQQQNDDGHKPGAPRASPQLVGSRQQQTRSRRSSISDVTDSRIVLADGRHTQPPPPKKKVQDHQGMLGQQQQQQPMQPQLQRRHLEFCIGADQDWSLQTGLAVTWLGTSSGSPTKERNISCTLVRVPEAVYMVDCGEGSYKQIKKTGVLPEQVDTIFMTHLHGDHCFGIGSMLISLCHARRQAMQQQQQQSSQQQQMCAPDQGPDKLRIVGPPQLGQLVAAMLVGAGVGRKLDMPVYVTEFVEDGRHAHSWQPLPGCSKGQAFLRRLAPEQQQQPAGHSAWLSGLQHRLDNSGLDWRSHPANTRTWGFQAKPGLVWRIPCQHVLVSAAQLQHRVPCWGFVFDEQQQQQLAPHIQQQQQQQQAQKPVGRRVVILGDTVDSAALAPLAYGADLVSHEATFAAGMEGKAAVAQHSTAWMAGQFASAIEAKALVLTHFSARYEGSMGNDKPGHGGNFGMHTGPGLNHGSKVDRTVNAPEAAAAEAEAEQRAVKALSREAEAHYLGQVLLAIDLFTTHVPKQGQDVSE